MEIQVQRTAEALGHDDGARSATRNARARRQRYGVAPSRFDLASWRESKREELVAAATDAWGHHHLSRLPAGENPDGFEVEMRDLAPRTVAYIRVLDPYRGDGVREAFERLIAWAEARGLADGQWLGYQWEDPEIVALEDCRYDVALEVDGVVAEGEIGRFDFPALRVAQVLIRGGVDHEMRALDWLFKTWLPASGYVPDDQPMFEAFLGRPFAHGFEHFELHARIPVRRA
ncbi:MAG: GyrI-like domain-containing protein [Planctomycetota bacterium]